MKIWRRTCWLCLVAIAFVVGMYIGHITSTLVTSRGGTDFAEVDTTYKFINPLLYCHDQNLSNEGAREIQDTITAYIEDKQNNREIIDGTVYFRDLNDGPWALIHQDFNPVPGSMLKVPVAISVYRRAELDPTFFTKSVTIPQGLSYNDDEFFKSSQDLQSGKAYTVKELVEAMLKYSDNNALYMLTTLFTEPEMEKAFTDLGIAPPAGAKQENYTISARTYSSFFRILYNGTYLTKEDSEQMLSILSQSQFNAGIVSGVPQGTKVAHKFGEFGAADGTVQLNDCGIIYKPKQPYLLCVMVKGTDYGVLSGVINHISNLVYDTLVTSSVGR